MVDHLIAINGMAQLIPLIVGKKLEVSRLALDNLMVLLRYDICRKELLDIKAFKPLLTVLDNGEQVLQIRVLKILTRFAEPQYLRMILLNI